MNTAQCGLLRMLNDALLFLEVEGFFSSALGLFSALPRLRGETLISPSALVCANLRQKSFFLSKSRNVPFLRFLFSSVFQVFLRASVSPW